MKITAIIGAIPGNDYNASHVLKIIYETMEEIGEKIDIINLAEKNLPYETGSYSKGAFSTIESEISSSDGIILVTTSNLFAPCAITQNFLEHFSKPIFKNTLKGKNCMIVAVSNTQDVTSTVNYLSMVVNYLGGYDSVKIPLNYSITRNMSEDDKTLIEKYTEDFYRYVNQNRRFFISDSSSKVIANAGGVFQKPVSTNNSDISPSISTEKYIDNNIENVPPVFQKQNISNKNSVENIYKKQAFKNAYNIEDDADILEITKSLENKLKTPPIKEDRFSINPIFRNDLTSINTDDLSPKTLTAKQQTQNLVHYFQPHLADGLVCDVAINITGDEVFDGVISINGKNIDYKDGFSKNPSVIISASSDVWKEIVSFETTTQRAFMTGQIKVRGNFVLLSKFDSLFKR